jgi:hypothetical protein
MVNEWEFSIFEFEFGFRFEFRFGFRFGFDYIEFDHRYIGFGELKKMEIIFRNLKNLDFELWTRHECIYKWTKQIELSWILCLLFWKMSSQKISFVFS